MAGVNTLEFVVTNFEGTVGNPTGVRVEVSGTGMPSAPPTPGALTVTPSAVTLGQGQTQQFTVGPMAEEVNFTYTYDTLNRLETVTDNRLGNATVLSYTDASEPLTMTYPNGVVHSFTHDTNGRVSQVTNNRGGSFAYTRRYAGAIETVTETGRSVSYTYDLAQRLLTETIQPSGSLAYTLDPVANRLTRTSDIPELPSNTSTYDANDRLTTDTYDANGNTLTSNGHTFAYDSEDRLTSYDAGTVVFTYDGDGNRVSRTAGGVTTRYLIDDLTPTDYAQVAEELQTGAVVRRYTHGAQRISQTQLIGGIWTPHYYGYDGGGTVRQLFDAAGAVTDTYNYDAFGTVIGSTGTTPNTYLYRGEHYDATLDMYYLRARWYWPKVGRFVTADKWEKEIAQPCCATTPDPRRASAHHLFGYTGADPVNGRDPSGHATLVESAGIYGSLLLSAVVIDQLMPRQHIDGHTLTPAGTLVYCVLKKVASLEANALVMMGATVDPSFLGGICTFSFAAVRDDSPTDADSPARPHEDDPCYWQYIQDTGECGARYTDDDVYEECMEVAWLNYQRCRQGQPRIRWPFIPPARPRSCR